MWEWYPSGKFTQKWWNSPLGYHIFEDTSIKKETLFLLAENYSRFDQVIHQWKMLMVAHIFCPPGPSAASSNPRKVNSQVMGPAWPTNCCKALGTAVWRRKGMMNLSFLPLPSMERVKGGGSVGSFCSFLLSIALWLVCAWKSVSWHEKGLMKGRECNKSSQSLCRFSQVDFCGVEIHYTFLTSELIPS